MGSVKVKNTGTVAGKRNIQLYIGDEKCSFASPAERVKGFQKVSLQPGEEKEITFTIKPEGLQFFDDRKHKWVAEPGKFKAYISSYRLIRKILWNLEYKIKIRYWLSGHGFRQIRYFFK